jgi:hypothetical protein
MEDGYPKLDETISLRIPAHMKEQFSNLNITQKHEAIEKMRITLARYLYESRFDPYKELNGGIS